MKQIWIWEIEPYEPPEDDDSCYEYFKEIASTIISDVRVRRVGSLYRLLNCHWTVMAARARGWQHIRVMEVT